MKNKKGLSGVIVTVIMIGLAMLLITIVWVVSSNIVSESTKNAESRASELFSYCSDLGYPKIESGQDCYGREVVSQDGKCCDGIIPDQISGLVGYWSFDKGSGTVAEDESGNGNDGTLVNGPTWVDGVDGKALSFDGEDDYVDCGFDTSLRITGDRTLCAWVKLSVATYPNAGTNWNIVVNENYENYGFAWRLDGSTGKQYFRNSRAGASSSHISDTAIGNNTKHFVAVVIESGTLTFYLDGESDGGGSITAQVASSSYLKIGSSSQGFDGFIDEPRIYNRALTEEEVKALYEKP